MGEFLKNRSAECSCGQLKVIARGEPIRVSICHCLACQRRTGGAFGVQARFPRTEISIEGRSTEYRRTADSGNQISFCFCPNCGSTVYYFLDQVPDIIVIPVGAFADPEFPAPRLSVYESRRHSWVDVPKDMEHYD